MTDSDTDPLRRQIEDLKAEVARLQQSENEAVYRSLFENNHAVMLLIDPVTAAIRDANPAACVYYGWSRDEIKRLRIDQINLLTAEDVCAQMELARSEQRRHFYFRHRRADGSVRDVEVYSGPLTVKGQTLLYSIVHDITDRMRAQKELAESERRISTLMANLPGMAYRCLDDASWTMTFVSQGCRELTGYPPENLLENRQTSYAELIHPDDRTTVREAVRRAIEGRTRFNLTYRIRCAGGEDKWVMEIGEGVFADTGQMLAIEGFITDITQRVNAERDKAKLEDQNRQLQKAESLSRMAGAIAHRFNNLLGVVLGNLEMVMNVLPSESPAVENLIDAIQAGRKTAEVSGLMLTYLGQSRAKADALDLSAACRRSLETIRSGMPKEVLLKCDLPSNGPVVRANAAQLQQALTNICTNAWEAIGAGRGTVQVAVKVVSPDEIAATNRFPLDWHPREFPHACIEVADSGCGIAGKDMEKLFDPFFSSKFTGRGLGLPVVLGVAKACGGGVTVESKPGKGSTFSSPPVEEQAPAIQPDPAGQPFRFEAGGTVLLAEDEEMLRKLTAAALNGLGLNVIAAGDGDEAIEAFRPGIRRRSCLSCWISPCRGSTGGRPWKR